MNHFSGDYNAEGTNYDVPNARVSALSLSGLTRRQYINGIFKISI